MDTEISKVLKMNLKCLRVLLVYPFEGEKPGPFYYARVAMGFLIYRWLLTCNILHFVTNIYYGKKIATSELMEDILMLCSDFVITIIIIWFVRTRKMLSEIIKELGDFSKFGKPINADEVNDNMDFFVKIHWIYTCIGVFFYAVAKSLDKEECEANKIKYGTLGVCGLFANTWLFFDVDYFPMKQVMLMIQIIGALGYLCVGSCSTSIVLVTTEHVICRIDHLNYNLLSVFNESSEKDQDGKLFWCIKYHSYIIHLTKRIDDCYKPMMFIHISMSAVIVATVAFTFLLTHSFKFLLYLFGLLIAIFMVCFAGQRLKNKSWEITNSIYSSIWYNVDPSLQRDIVLMLMRSQRELCLTAGGFGVMSFDAFTMICQSVYSYLTLISTQLK